MSAAAANIAIDKVWKYFGDYPAVRDVSFKAGPGECVALLGRNGAGKTTLLRIAAGLSRATEGKVDINDRIGWLGHGIGIYEELSAIENLTTFARLQDVSDPRGRAVEWLKRVYLDHVQDARVREYSRGMRQRLAVARAFIHDPGIILFDEPFTSLDDRAIALLQSILRDALDRGKSVILSTHQLREAMELATHVALLDRGQLKHYGPRPEEMLTDTGWLYRTFGVA